MGKVTIVKTFALPKANISINNIR